MTRCLAALLSGAVLLGQESPKPHTTPRGVQGELQGTAEQRSGARVTVWANSVDSHDLDPIADGKADPNGQFALKDVPWFTEPAWKWNSIVVIARNGDHSIGLQQIRGDTVDPGKLAVAMQPTIELTGNVRGRDDRPIGGATVWLRIVGNPPNTVVWFTGPLPQWQVRTDAEGRYRMRGVPAGHRLVLTAIHPDCEEQPGQVEAGATTCDFTLEPGARIEGTVRNPDGSPAAHVRVAAIGNSSKRLFRRSETDDQGRFELRSLGADKYNVWADAPGLTVAAIDSLPVTSGEVVRGQHLQLLRGGRIVGRVVDVATGQPVEPGAWGDVAMYGPARPSSNGACQAFDVAGDGSFAIHAPPGRNRVYLRPADGWQTVIGQHFVEVSEGAESTVEFSVRRKAAR